MKFEYVKPGSKNEETRCVQQIIKDSGGDPGPIDGIYGPLTKAAILKWQEENGLIVDGIVGPQTFQWMLENIESAKLRVLEMIIRKGYQ